MFRKLDGLEKAVLYQAAIATYLIAKATKKNNDRALAKNRLAHTNKVAATAKKHRTRTAKHFVKMNIARLRSHQVKM